MMTHYTNLWVAVLTREQHNKTCGYWYTITSHATAHTAFKTLRGFQRWLDERNLRLSAELTAPGTWSYQQIIGEYAEESTMDITAFEKLPHIMETKEMSNGDYTLAKITESGGIRTVHTLNPNVDRVIYDYRLSDREMS